MRQDYDMAFLLKYENVAWYQDGLVRILDRRTYPYDLKFVECKTFEEVAQAIKDMVTQSAGPYTAAGMGMALAAHQGEGLARADRIKLLEEAGEAISTARPTTESRMRQVTDRCLKRALETDGDMVEAILDTMYESLDRRYSAMQRVGDNLAGLFPEKGHVMTQCYGETIVGTMLRASKKMGRDISFIVPETRPFLQGARLTASVIKEMGFDLRVISDNMAAWAMDRYKVDLFTSAADSITRDGYVVNKVGTLGLAILAKHFGIPYYVTGVPDRDYIKDLEIEFRDPIETLSHLGKKVTLEGVEGLYPAFDITPPDLVTGYVTDRGIFTRDNLEDYYKFEGEFY